MNIFYIQPDDKNWGNLYNDNIEAKHLWNIPGVRCPLCRQTWATIGIAYPLVDLTMLSSNLEFSGPWPVDIETYKKLRNLVAPLLSEGFPIPPGTEFGPLYGRVEGKTGDFAWVNYWTILIHHEIYMKLTLEGVRLPRFSIPRLEVDEKESYGLVEFQVEPITLLSPFSYSLDQQEKCSLCERDTRKVEHIIVDIRTIPPNVDMFRVRDFPTKILVTERFKSAVNKLELTNILFSRVMVD